MTKQAHKRNSREAVWRAVAGVLGVLLLIWALLPLLRHILNVGVAALGAAGLLLLGGAIWFGEVKHLFAYIWEKRWLRFMLLVVCGVVVALLALFIAVSGFMLHAAAKKAPENATVIVLGAGLQGDQPSRMLRDRLNAAARYLEANPESVCIVSGGQGADEICTEASVMRRYLLEKGIAEERVILEDKSTNTAENLRFSRELIQSRGLNERVVIATQEFHQYRAQSFAKPAGLEEAGACTCRTPLYLLGCYWVREFAGICRMLLLGY